MRGSFTERHVLPMVTPPAILTGGGRVDFHQSSASLYRFARQLREKRRPGGVCNAFRQTMLVDHPVHTEVFHTDDPEEVDYLAAFLMGEVLTFPGDPLMNTGNYLAVFAPFWRPFGKLAVLALDCGKSFFFLTEKAGIFNCLPIGERQRFSAQRHYPPHGCSLANAQVQSHKRKRHTISQCCSGG